MKMMKKFDKKKNLGWRYLCDELIIPLEVTFNYQIHYLTVSCCSPILQQNSSLAFFR